MCDGRRVTARRTRTPVALASAARLLPRSRREGWRRDRTLSLLHDLNGVYFIVLRDDPGATELHCQDAQARIAQRLAGIRWIAGQVLVDTWRFIREEMEDPEDAFGPAVVLMNLAGEDRRVRQWLATLAPQVAAALDAVGLHVGHGSSRRPA